MLNALEFSLRMMCGDERRVTVNAAIELRRRLGAVRRRRGQGAFLLLCLLTVLSGVGARAAEPEDSFKKGIAALDQRNWTIAVASFQKAIAARPKEGGKSIRISARSTWYVDYLPHYYLGVALSQLGDVAGATASWNESLRQGFIQNSSMHEELFRRMNQLRLDSAVLIEKKGSEKGEDGPSRTAQDAVGATASTTPGKTDNNLTSSGAVAQRGAGDTAVSLRSGAIPSEASQAPVGSESLDDSRVAFTSKDTIAPPSSTAGLVGSSDPREVASPKADPAVAPFSDRGAELYQADREERALGELTKHVARLYFSGQYSSARAKVRQAKAIASENPILCMLDAAAAYALFRSEGEIEQRLLKDAKEAVLRCRALAVTVVPSETLFSPAFRTFWSNAK